MHQPNYLTKKTVLFLLKVAKTYKAQRKEFLKTSKSFQTEFQSAADAVEQLEKLLATFAGPRNDFIGAISESRLKEKDHYLPQAKVMEAASKLHVLTGRKHRDTRSSCRNRKTGNLIRLGLEEWTDTST